MQAVFWGINPSPPLRKQRCVPCDESQQGGRVHAKNAFTERETTLEKIF